MILEQSKSKVDTSGMKENNEFWINVTPATFDLVIAKLYSDPIKAFRNAIERAGIELPRGQSSHVLRHTFASHFMMNAGNILTLQKILGSVSIFPAFIM